MSDPSQSIQPIQPALRQPSPAYLDATRAEVQSKIDAARAAEADLPEFHTPDYWEAAEGDVDKRESELRSLLADIHAHPEVAFEETYAQERIAQALERAGLGLEVERGAFGVDTSLRARYQGKPGGRTVAVLAEYDALPGLGHACGHNVIATAGVGGFLAAVAALRSAGGAGTVVFLGTPAEEGHSGKEYMIRGGALEGIDAAVMIHPFAHDIAAHYWNGRRSLSATFRGISAHASAQPFMGRNALDAATLAYQGFGLLRQQMPPSDRLHAVLTEGGQRASVIPDTAVLQMYVRSLYPETLVDLSERVDAVLRGAALMAGCEVEVNWDDHPATLPLRNNGPLSRRWAASQRARGRHPLPAGIIPSSLAASTDFGNVSHLVPGLHPMVKIAPDEVALHTEAFERCAITEDAYRGALDSAVGLGQVAADFLLDDAFAEAARAEFEAAGGAKTSSEFFSTR